MKDSAALSVVGLLPWVCTGAVMLSKARKRDPYYMQFMNLPRRKLIALE
jgi:hypothetical protein